MIHNIECANVNYGLAFGIETLLKKGNKQGSRNGPVLVHPMPVCTTYYNPTHRVLFSKYRDANPFFHLMEGLWMLAGRNDIKWPAFFASNMANYSDDGETQNGAYGYRWRKHFGVDQLEWIVHELRARPDSRRAVLAMWDGALDMKYAFKGGKDAPCNTHIYFTVDKRCLDMMVMCRSNDIIWGCYGANAVHMSMLHEYMAAWLGLIPGKYRQLSANFHAYLEKYNETQLVDMAADARQADQYTGNRFVKPRKLVDGPVEEWDRYLNAFLDNPLKVEAKAPDFFKAVAYPMYLTWWSRKQRANDGLLALQDMDVDNDWRRAAEEWIARRKT